MKTTLQKIFTGEHKYTVGILYLLAHVASYFVAMRKVEIDDKESLFFLMFVALFIKLIV